MLKNDQVVAELVKGQRFGTVFGKLVIEGGFEKRPYERSAVEEKRLIREGFLGVARAVDRSAEIPVIRRIRLAV